MSAASPTSPRAASLAPHAPAGTATDAPAAKAGAATAHPVPAVLEVGCGSNKSPGTCGLDKLALPGVDLVHDIERAPWPIADASFDVVRCRHVLEHVHDLCAVMDELHRITRPGGRIEIVVPYFARYSAFKDPTHRRFCTYESFNYFVEGTAERERSYSARSFRYVEHRLRFASGLRGRIGQWLFRRGHRWYERHWAWQFPARTLQVVLEPHSDPQAHPKRGARPGG
jgi:SAM-dependent methyltransferase